MKSVNLKVDPDLWQKAKIEAVKRGIDLKDLIAEAIREILEKQAVKIK